MLSNSNDRGKVMVDITERLQDDLAAIAVGLMADVAENENFRRNPDSFIEHEPKWHQFGIITHTRKFLDHYQTDAGEYFEKWGISSQIERYLTERMDDKSKAELLPIGILLHDIGKFARGFKDKDGKVKPNYDGHEAKSEQAILREGNIRYRLQRNNLTDDEIKYIARCAGLHFELGKMRAKAKQSDWGYTIAFIESEHCQQVCTEIAQKFPEFKTEIGLLFLCDSMAKTDVVIDAETDLEIVEQTPYAEQVLLAQRLNPALIAAVKQGPVNIAVARKYLRGVFMQPIN
jgi:hypothetical protein